MSSDKVVTLEQMQEIEKEAERKGYSRLLMMENAGRAVADTVNALYAPILGPKIIAVCGTGNNGGDCISAARHLSSQTNVTSILVGETHKIKTEEAKQQWIIARGAPMRIYVAPTKDELLRHSSLIAKADVVLDGLFGTGVRPPIGEPFRTAINEINRSSALKISIDLPSGMNPDTGEISDIAVFPDVTIVLHRMKLGLIKEPSKCGRLIVKSIGISLTM